MPKVQPMVVGIWQGDTKPVLNEYIKPLIAEMESLISSGISINEYHVNIKFGLVIGDTPARSLMKGIYIDFAVFYSNFRVQIFVHSNAKIVFATFKHNII